jgi:hypothetical protein
MTLDEILANWDADSSIDKNDLANESLKIPKLHHKYYSIFVQERLKHTKMLQVYDERREIFDQWLAGELDTDTLKQNNLEVNRKMYTKAEREKKVDALPEIIDRKLKLALQKEKIECLESIIKTLSTRGYQIKTAVDFIKFQMGA